jgi:hypothetical protein
VPCIFCFAALTLLAGAVTAQTVEHLQHRLTALAAGGQVERVSDTGSVTLFQLTVEHPRGGSAGVPVAVTLYKQQAGVRIQVLTHSVDATVARDVEARIAAALDARIVERVAAPVGHGHGHAAPAEAAPARRRLRLRKTPEQQ